MFGLTSHAAKRQSSTQNDAPIRVDFLLIPNFSMIAFTSSIEPLRIANRISGKTLYVWNTISQDGEGVKASNGVAVSADRSFANEIDTDIVIVCAGTNPERHLDKSTNAALRRYARAGLPLGSVCTGTLALAEAGLLDGYRLTIHWENIESFVETYPHLNVTATLFELDRDRFTCAGGTAALDMMLHAISLDHGETLAADVADLLIHTNTRQPSDHQRMPLQHRTGITNPKLLAAIGYMEAYTENPLGLGELAESVKVSLRQLERLFRSSLDTTPARYYLELRLQRSRNLVKNSSMSIMQIAVATGFTSAAHFTKSYRSYFGHTPTSERSAGER